MCRAQPPQLPKVPQTPPVAVTRAGLVVRDGNGLATCAPRSLVCRPLAGIDRAARDRARLDAGAARGRARRRRVELWSGGRPVRRLGGLATNVQSLAFAASRTLLAGVGVRTLAIWNPATGALLHARRLPAAATAVAVAPDGSRIAIGLADGRVLVAGADGATTATLHPHGAPNVSLAFLPDGTLLTGSFDGSLERWDVRHRPAPRRGPDRTDRPRRRRSRSRPAARSSSPRA